MSVYMHVYTADIDSKVYNVLSVHCPSSERNIEKGSTLKTLDFTFYSTVYRQYTNFFLCNTAFAAHYVIF